MFFVMIDKTVSKFPRGRRKKDYEFVEMVENVQSSP